MPLYGPKWPLARGKEDTYQLYSDLKSQTGFYLKNLLLTSPGENLSDPLYGVGLRRFMFQNNVQSVRDQMKSVIQNQIITYLSYIKLQQVSVSATSEEIDSNSLRIKVIYSIPDKIQNAVFELSTEDIGFY
jgi:phage baseplate assembly protein W